MTPLRSRRPVRALLGALLALGVAADAGAVVGALDDVPAATLLLPYFEVDLADANGPQTRFTLDNAEAEPLTAHVTLWSNLGIPTYAFDVYLGGRDALEVDLRLAFAGVLPRTAADAHPPGPYSEAPAAACAAQPPGDFYPGFPVQPIAPASLAHLRNAHTGRASTLTGNLCVGAAQADQIARGYVTIDVANACGPSFPGDAGYFAQGGTGFASNRNALTGTYAVLDRGRGVAAAALVALEADAADAVSSGAGTYTFWAKAVGGRGVDNREPLGTVWQARMLDLPDLDAGTELVIWRDAPTVAPFACVQGFPPPFPLGQTEVSAIDERENVDTLDQNPFPNPPVLAAPYAAQRVDAALLSPFASGFLHLNLNTTLTDPPLPGSPLLQSYVATRHQLGGAYDTLQPGTFLLGPQHQKTGAGGCSAGVLCNGRPPRIGF